MNYPMLRLLLFEKWFRVAFAGLLLLVVFLALFLPKIWTASEPGFRPIIKVSGLDLLQARSLKRTAQKAGAAGHFDEAHYAWQSALANNRADPELVRGALHAFLSDPRRSQVGGIGPAIQESFWLLKLTGTNVADLELSAKVLAKFNYGDAILPLVQSRIDRITPGSAVIYLKTLFEEGRMEEFDARWSQLIGKLPDDPELQLYRAAYLAGWGPPGSISSARQQLQAASSDPRVRIVAYRLILSVSAHELKPDEYRQSLKSLEDLREDSVIDHVRYWRLLNATGSLEEAKHLAREYSGTPTSPMELIELARANSELGMRDQGLDLLERHGPQFAYSAMFWVSYAHELTEAKRWDSLRKLGVQIRGQESVRDQLGGFSYFIEGRAELALGRQAAAKAAFEKAAEREFPFPSLGQLVAKELTELDENVAARKILAGLKPALEKDPSYWFLVFSVADQLKDVDLLVKAASRGYELLPDNIIAVNNYAAALIISRQNPREAIKLTLELMAQSPNSLHAVVNHSAALLLNDRAKEAEALLSRVRTNGLTRAQLTLFNLDLFETYTCLGEFDRAWSVIDQIEPDSLYPTQRKWLEAARRKLPPRQNPG